MVLNVIKLLYYYLFILSQLFYWHCLICSAMIPMIPSRKADLESRYWYFCDRICKHHRKKFSHDRSMVNFSWITFIIPSMVPMFSIEKHITSHDDCFITVQLSDVDCHRWDYVLNLLRGLHVHSYGTAQNSYGALALDIRTCQGGIIRHFVQL